MDLEATKRLKIQLLILRTQAGSESGFEELFQTFKGTTMSYLSELVGKEDLEDLQQKVWFKVYKQISSLTSPFGFKRWLMQVTHRTALDHLRIKNSDESRFVEDFELDTINIPGGENVEIPKDFDSLHLALNKLSSRHKEVILLFYWQEFSCSDISQILDCSVGTVKSRLSIARGELQKMKIVKKLN